MNHFELIPDDFTDLAELHDPWPFATIAAFIAARERTTGDPLEAEWAYTTNPGINYDHVALVITVTSN